MAKLQVSTKDIPKVNMLGKSLRGPIFSTTIQPLISYKEPEFRIKYDVLREVNKLDLWPEQYIMKELNAKKVNYVTSTYFLLLKRQELRALSTLII